MLEYLGSYLRPFRKQFIIGPLFKLAEAVLELTLPLYMARIINEGIVRQDTSLIRSLGLRMLITIVVNLICATICQYCASVASQGFGTKARDGIFSHINRLSFPDLDRLGTDTLITRITNDINQLQVAVAMSIRLISRAPFVSIGAIVLAMRMDLSLSVIIWVGVGSFIAVLAVIMRAAFPLYSDAQRLLDRVGRVLRENLSGVRVIRAFDRVSVEFRRFVLAVDAHRKKLVYVSKIASLMNPATALIMNILICAILWFGGIRVQTGDIMWGEISAFISYIGLILNALLVVANLVVIFTKSAASLTRVNEVFSLAPAFGERERADESALEKNGRETESNEALSFSRVSFSYTGDAAQNVLSEIDFTLKRGESLGIIGGTGSGKTTLLSLILRFYTGETGEIRLFGQKIGHFAPENLRSRIACVFQTPRLFSGTIRENLFWGKITATEKEMRESVCSAQAEEFVNTLPDGLDSRIERDGANFSGGQKQRLSIARALLRKPELLLLDDASSALDYATEAKLRGSIRELQQRTGMSVVIVSQRIASVRHSETILVLREGRQVGRGSHSELMKNCPDYRLIASSQLPEEEVS